MGYFVKVISVFLNIFNILTTHNVFSSLYPGTKQTDEGRILPYTANFVCTAIVYLFADNFFVLTVAEFFTVLWISLTYREKLNENIPGVGILTLLFTVPDHLARVATDSDISYVLSRITVTMLISAGSLLPRCRFEKDRTEKYKNYPVIFMIFVILCSLAAEVVLIQENGITGKALIISLPVFAADIFAYFLYESSARHYVRSVNMEMLRRENDLYFRQCEIMEKSTEEMRSFRHDLNNQFIALSRLLSEGQTEKARKHLDSLFSQTKQMTVYSCTGNIPVDSIINYKLRLAETEHIKISTHIAIPPDIKMDTADIVTVLGNLLDNAIEATVLKREDRRIYLKLFYTQGRLVIRVSNSYNGQIRKDGDRMVTTKTDNKRHGYGLANVEKIAEKYGGVLKIGNTEDEFTADLLMYPEN